MSRFGTLDTRYLDAAGNPLGGGKIYFYESGTTTAKTTYTTSAQNVANPQPFVLDAGGAQGGGIFFTGQAKAVLRDSLGVLVLATGTQANRMTSMTWSKRAITFTTSASSTLT